METMLWKYSPVGEEEPRGSDGEGDEEVMDQNPTGERADREVNLGSYFETKHLFTVGELTLGLVAMDDVRRVVRERNSTCRDQFSPHNI